ncbi:MAG: tRNA-specific 2-thiouridylase MnmA [uncultured Chloroflexi bacterium]|uniref:tRNA-specific 2-thiouridylase MnmA n=1 Tax=uncultured Chloroflexota bacterium TaxID=166587 RepID=A0A6J4JL02_9CHLR|nr:MAG: tRNA-specific 2-thiouridylase MnmA [uncultured Chloroflexota bacterium]
MSRIVVAMSGGVDSSVVAALLKQQGHDVIGVTLNVWPESANQVTADARDDADAKVGAAEPAGSATARSKACCGNSAVDDARRVADLLDMPYYVLNFRELFREYVIADFVREYARGRTPNPCVRCNQHVKFRPVLQRAAALGADYVATGHYVRRDQDPATGRWRLRKALDPSKDQSYVLFPMQQDELARTLFPLGDMPKTETRRLARELGLPVAEKPESMEICFVPDNKYSRYVTEHAPQTALPGPIVDVQGRYLGEHPGIVHFTIGQRRGIGIASPEPLFVIDIDPERNAIVVGADKDLLCRELIAEDLNLVALPALDRPIRCRARIRYRMSEAPATIEPVEQTPNGAPGASGNAAAPGMPAVRVVFDEPQRAITPGQAVVFYDGDVVLGGATIVQSGDL